MNDTNLTAHMMDHRGAERIDINATVEFRCNKDEEFRQATMVDFSESGMLLLMNEKHAEGSQFEVRVEEKETIFFTVTCVRICPDKEANAFGYGCKIIEHQII